MRVLGSCAAALAVGALLAAPSVAGPDRAPAATYGDEVGDAGDAPDIARVTIRPAGTSLEVDVKLAEPTALGRYGWILFGFDTDRDAFTGGGRGDELLVLTNGDATTLARWVDGRFTTSFRAPRGRSRALEHRPQVHDRPS